MLKNLNKEVQAIEGRTLKGLIRASIIVRRSMDKNSPMIPVDTGNLRASWFVVTSKGATQRGRNPSFKGDDASEMSTDHSSLTRKTAVAAKSMGKPVVILGFSANYAWYVHEMVGANFRQPKKGAKGGGQRGAKFFEAALKREKKEMLAVIQEEAKIK